MRIDGKALKHRLGQTKLNTDTLGANKVTSLVRFYKDDGSTRYLVGLYTTKLYSFAAVPTEITRTSGTWTSGANLGRVVMDNNLFLADGSTAPQKWTGTGSTTDMAGTPPTTTNIAVMSPTANRIFFLGGKTLTYGALGNSEDYTTANDAGFARIPFSEGENGTALAVTPNGTLLIFSSSSTHTLTGQDPANFVRRELDPAVGTRAPRSIANGRGGTYFLGQDNQVYWNNGQGNIPVGEKIQATLDAGSTGDYANAVGWVEKNRYHLAFSAAGTSNDTVLVLDWKANNGRGGWVLDKQVAVASVAVDDGLAGQVYTGDYAGFVQQQDSGTTDNGTAVASFVETKFDTYDEPERRKKTKRTYVKFEPVGSYSMTVYVAKDGGTFAQQGLVSMSSGGAQLDSALYALDDVDTALDGGNTEGVSRVSAVKNCRSLKHKFSISNPFRLLGYSTILSKKTVK